MTLDQALNQIAVLADGVRQALLNGNTTIDLIPVLQANDDAARVELQAAIDEIDKLKSKLDMPNLK